MTPSTESIETQADAVNYFRTLGYHSEARKWAPGDTVWVGIEPSDSEAGFTLYRLAFYICPIGDEWQVDDPEQLERAPIRCASLREACARLERLIVESLAVSDARAAQGSELERSGARA